MKTPKKLGGIHLAGNNMPVEEALKKLGRAIRAKRLDMNVGQQDVAEHTGVSESVVRRLESGKPVSSENLTRILMALGLLKALLDIYRPPEMSLKERFELEQKQAKNRRVRASKK